MNIAIVDDEQAISNEIKSMFSQLGFHDISIFESGEEFLFSCVEQTFDLVLFDIQMKQQNGIDTARRLREKDPHVSIVFLTNDPSYVFDGYEVHAIRYWLKPLKLDKLKQLMDGLFITKPYIIWDYEGEQHKLYEEDIYYLESDGHYVCCHHKTGTYRKKGIFKVECDRLSSDFIPTHRSYYVNVNHIHVLKKNECVLDTNEPIPVSRTCKTSVQTAMMKRCKEDLLCNF